MNWRWVNVVINILTNNMMSWIWLVSTHTQYQTYDFIRNGLLAQYSIIFHCVPCSKLTSLIFVAAFLRPCVSKPLAPLAGHVSLVLYYCWTFLCSQHSKLKMKDISQPFVAYPAFLTPIGFQSSLYSILYSSIEPIPITMCNIITLMKKATQNILNLGCLKVIHSHNYS